MASYIEKPQPGDFGLSRTPGIPGAILHVVQLINRDHSYWTHSFVVLDDGEVIEAARGGARISSLSKYDGRRVSYSNVNLSEYQRNKIVQEARSMEGIPYSYMDYVYLALKRFGLGYGLVKNYVKYSGRLICSQFVDEAHRRAGVHLFDDGRLPQDVTPGDLARFIQTNH